MNEKPSDSWNFLPNAGQVFDHGGAFRGDVKFTTGSTFPTLHAMKDNRIAVVIPELDTANAQNNLVHRLDLSFGGQGALSPTPSLYDLLPHRYNFFEQYTPQGITGVSGGRSVVYENMYDKIDLHITSNQWGPKLYIVVRPGGNPNDIELLCQGHDSLEVDVDGYLKLYFDTKFIKLTQGLAYQQQGESIQLLTWYGTYAPDSDGLHVNVNFDTYNPELPLIFMIRPFNPELMPVFGGGMCDIPEWSTYLGGSGDDAVADLTHDNEGNFYYTGRSSSGMGIPISAGANQPFLEGQTDVVLGRGNQFYELRTQDESTWCTFFGGPGPDEGRSAVFDEVNDRLVLGGFTGSSSFDFPNILYPGNSSCYNRTNSSSAFISYFDKGTGIPNYFSRLPGFGPFPNTVEVDVDVDANGNTYVTTGGLITLESELSFVPPPAYIQTVTGGGPFLVADGFIMRMDATANVTWATVFGGPRDEMITSCAVDRERGLLYVAGWTNTSNHVPLADACVPANAQVEFPLCGSGSQYIQNKLNSFFGGNASGLSDGFIAMFDLNDLSLDWSTYFGGTGGDNITDITTNSQGEVFIVGTTKPYDYSPNPCPSISSSTGFPNCDAGGFFLNAPNGRKHFIARFESGGRLTWSTVLGDRSDVTLFERTRVTLDENDNVILYGSTMFPAPGPDPIIVPFFDQTLNDAYFCVEHNDVFMGPRSDTYLMMFDANTELLYGTYFGGIGDEYAGAVVAFDGRIYIGGTVYAGLNFPIHAPSIDGHEPYLDDLPNAQLTVPDAFLAQLLFNYTVGVPESGSTSNTELVAFPNPTTGRVTFKLPERVGTGRIDLFDSVGRLVLSQPLKNVGSIELDLSPLATGSYTARAYTGERALVANIQVAW